MRFDQIKYLLSLLLIIYQGVLLAQVTRTKSLGGLTYGIKDRDHSLNIYDFGSNPAWLLNDELSDRLEMTPSVNNDWGDYRRLYSPEGTVNYNVGFTGIKNLGRSGTFKGRADYHYSIRRNNYRTLKKDTYAGEAFYFTDTTAGDFRYSGPTFEIMHSIMLIDDLFVGGEVNYRILDGLKQVYTYAQTLYRNVSGKIGLAYALTDNLSIGTTVYLFDTQERIEANDVNLLTVQTYHFRGEKNAVMLSGTTQDYKLKKEGMSLGAQIYWDFDDFLQMGFNGTYSSSKTRTLFPVSLIIENEDGYSFFDGLNLSGRLQYKIEDKFLVGLLLNFNETSSWSKNSQRDLLLWDWKVREIKAGIGSSYLFENLDLLVGAEYEYAIVNSDSQKYVDNRFSSLESADHTLRTGAEFTLSDMIVLRGGYNFEYNRFDLILGGEEIVKNRFTGGLRLNLSESIFLDGHFEYSVLSDDSYEARRRSGWESVITLTFNSF